MGLNNSSGDQFLMSYNGTDIGTNPIFAISSTCRIGLIKTSIGGGSAKVQVGDVASFDTNVGIGTTSPATILHVVGACGRFESDTVSRAIDIDPTSGSVEMSDNTNSLHLQRNHNGNVQVGFQSSAGLHVQNCAGFGASPATGIPVVVVKDSVSTKLTQVF